MKLFSSKCVITQVGRAAGIVTRERSVARISHGVSREALACGNSPKGIHRQGLSTARTSCRAHCSLHSQRGPSRTLQPTVQADEWEQVPEVTEMSGSNGHSGLTSPISRGKSHCHETLCRKGKKQRWKRTGMKTGDEVHRGL